MAKSPRKLKFGLINSKKQQPGPLAIPLKTAIYKGTGGSVCWRMGAFYS